MSILEYCRNRHISPLTVAALQAAGYDTIRVNEILPQSAPDPDIIEAARQRGATIITFDLDFKAKPGQIN